MHPGVHSVRGRVVPPGDWSREISRSVRLWNAVPVCWPDGVRHVSEADTCTKYVVPKLRHAGWDDEPSWFAEQRTFTDGRYVSIGSSSRRLAKKRADYLLYHTPDFLLAVVEAALSRSSKVARKPCFTHPFASHLRPTRSRSRSRSRCTLPAGNGRQTTGNGREMYVAGKPLAAPIGLKGQGKATRAGTGTGTGTGRGEPW